MMMEEQADSRRIRNKNTDSVGVDRISSLPDSILGVILSFIPTEEAVAASILSKRWKSTWLDVHNLHFSCYSSANNISFPRFVHRVFRLTHARPLNKFRLIWRRTSISSHVICWIDNAISRNVRDIDICLGPHDRGEILRLPISGFNCDSLQSLKISTIFFVYDTTTVCLPRLESLKLDNVRFTSEQAFEKLVNGCPMLHSLRLTVFSSSSFEDAEEYFMYIVSSPSLRHLDMYIQDRCTLKLNAPSLEYLKLHGRFSEIFLEKSLTSLVEADFDTELNEHDSPCNVIVEVVRLLRNTKFLTLSATVMRGLGLAKTSLSTDFKRLVKLVARTYCCSVQDIILKSEILEELIIDEHDWWRQSTIGPYDHSKWTAPLVFPICLSKSLKNVRFNGYKGLEDERQMIRYMLEHGAALEVMQIRCCSDQEPGKRLELVQEICEFPRKSSACQVSTC